jgi:hypothetical protein
MASLVNDGLDTDNLGRELERNGVVSVEDYLDDEQCDKIRNEVLEKLEVDEFERGDGNTDYRNASRTLLKQRTGKYDDGMINIFNIDETIPKIKEIKNDNFIRDVIKYAAGQQFRPQNINIYYNQSITNTRGYHFDSYHKKFKSFVYLTDVPDESHGPYSYVKRSHDRSYVRRRLEGIVNKIRGEKITNAIWFDDDDVVTFTKPKGTLIISDQTGFHRGIPQKKGRKRMMISNAFTPEKIQE